MTLRRVTEAEVTAANLRRMARDLLLEAERLEAAAGATASNASNKKGHTYTCHITGKKKYVQWGKLPASGKNKTGDI